MSTDVLPVTRIAGTPAAAGRRYGEIFEQAMLGFMHDQLAPTKERLAYARKCWAHVQKHAPASAAFMQGMAKGSHLLLDHVTLLSLHEEIVHEKHCTAFAATRSASRAGKTLIGQNWDWSAQLYPWAGLLHLSITGSPRIMAYHYPGLWQCAGVNQHGLGLVWTGGGYLPRIPPVVGLPTYVLIAEILRRRTVAEAVQYIDSITNAGCFLFFLGDATGDAAVVEGVSGKPGKVVVDRSDDALLRANHYECPAVVKKAKQKLDDKNPNVTTCPRRARMHTLVEKHRGEFTRKVAEAILTDRSGKWPWLHQFPGGKHKATTSGMTIDSIYAVCQDRALVTCRGGRVPGPWRAHRA